MKTAEKGVMRNALRVMITRELWALDREIAAYPDDESPWKIVPGISNSAGNLVLHLAGNLRHFVGAAIGGTGYVRDRASEFSATGLSREELRVQVRTTIADLEVAFEKMTDDQLKAEFPLLIGDRKVRAADWLVHLAVHPGYHLGQIDYHRRILTESSSAVDAMSIRELEELET